MSIAILEEYGSRKTVEYRGRYTERECGSTYTVDCGVLEKSHIKVLESQLLTPHEISPTAWEGLEFSRTREELEDDGLESFDFPSLGR